MTQILTKQLTKVSTKHLTNILTKHLANILTKHGQNFKGLRPRAADLRKYFFQFFFDSF